MYTIYLNSWAYGTEEYVYNTEEEARNGFFRLYASSVAHRRDDLTARIIIDATRTVIVDARSVAEHPELTMRYRNRLYALDEEKLTEERKRWENDHDYTW